MAFLLAGAAGAAEPVGLILTEPEARRQQARSLARLRLARAVARRLLLARKQDGR